MARIEGDFEKGEAGGAYAALTVIHATASAATADLVHWPGNAW
jgi:hypothetical protein